MDPISRGVTYAGETMDFERGSILLLPRELSHPDLFKIQIWKISQEPVTL
jgi:hypothetical protein